MPDCEVDDRRAIEEKVGRGGDEEGVRARSDKGCKSPTVVVVPHRYDRKLHAQGRRSPFEFRQLHAHDVGILGRQHADATRARYRLLQQLELFHTERPVLGDEHAGDVPAWARETPTRCIATGSKLPQMINGVVVVAPSRLPPRPPSPPPSRRHAAVRARGRGWGGAQAARPRSASRSRGCVLRHSRAGPKAKGNRLSNVARSWRRARAVGRRMPRRYTREGDGGACCT